MGTLIILVRKLIIKNYQMTEPSALNHFSFEKELTAKESNVRDMGSSNQLLIIQQNLEEKKIEELK